MTTAEENFYLLERIDADRQFLLLAMQSNPALLARADTHIQALILGAVPPAGRPSGRKRPAEAAPTLGEN